MPKDLTKDQIIRRISACKGLQRQDDSEIPLKTLTTEMRPRLIGIMSKLSDTDRCRTVLIRHAPQERPDKCARK
jgi:hypothetical protein